MSPSILNDTKKYLGIHEDYTAFDSDVLMQINSAITTLVQIGVGPSLGLFVKDKETDWDALVGSKVNLLGAVQNYVYMKAKLGFDPPQTAYHVTALRELITEAEWRLELAARAPVVLTNDPDYVIQGGNA